MSVSKIALEKQNKDLKTQKENLQAKLEIDRESFVHAKRRFEMELKGKDNTIAMLQAEIKALTEELKEYRLEIVEN